MWWRYGEDWRVGYEVWKDEHKGKNIHGPLRYRAKTVNQMGKPKMEFLDQNGNNCPWDLGIDIIVTPEIGVALYVLLQAYVQVLC